MVRNIKVFENIVLIIIIRNIKNQISNRQFVFIGVTSSSYITGFWLNDTLYGHIEKMKTGDSLYYFK